MTPLPIYADLTRISQVISNLLNNAAKYTPDGGEIRLAARQENNEAVVTVTDNGVGIPQDMQDRVFDLFTQVEGGIKRSTRTASASAWRSRSSSSSCITARSPSLAREKARARHSKFACHCNRSLPEPPEEEASFSRLSLATRHPGRGRQHLRRGNHWPASLHARPPRDPVPRRPRRSGHSQKAQVPMRSSSISACPA